METYNYIAKLITTPLPAGQTAGLQRYQIYEPFAVVDPVTGDTITNHRIVSTMNMTLAQCQAVLAAIQAI